MATVLTREEARDRFACGNPRYDMVFEAHERFLVLPGPMEIEGSFGSGYLPEGETVRNFDCIIVDGDLTVSGRVLFDAPWPGLLVRGHFEARILENQYASILVLGNADVAQVIYGVSNDGYLLVRGGVTAPYLILKDQSFRVDGEARIGTVVNDRDYGILGPEEFDSVALFDPGVERALVAEVFVDNRFSLDLFLDRQDRSLPVLRNWDDLHPGYARVRAFLPIFENAEPEEVDRAATELLKELDALAFDHAYARLWIADLQAHMRSKVVEELGDARSVARWGESAEALASLLHPAPPSREEWRWSPMEVAVMEACETLNKYGWHVFQHSEDPEELARAARVMRPALPWCRPWDHSWYVIDTAVRLLLKTGQQDEAFREVKRILEEYPAFEDFRDINRGAEYRSWLRLHQS